MTSLPVITAVIPTFRRPHQLKKAIQSVLNQTYPHLQVCVYDNCSGDETAQVVNEFIEKDARVKYHCHTENIGVQRNHSYGLEHVDTPYFSFLADDDRLLPWFYETVISGFEQFPDIGFSGGSGFCIDPQGKVLVQTYRDAEPRRYYSCEETLQKLNSISFPVWTSIVFRRKCVEKTGGINTDTGLIDCDFLFRYAAYFPCVLFSRPCAVCVRHPGSFSNTIKLNMFRPGLFFRTLEKLSVETPAFARIEPPFEETLSKRFKFWFFMLALVLIQKEEYKEAIKYAVYMKRHLRGKTLPACILFGVKLSRDSGLAKTIFRKIINAPMQQMQRYTVYKNRSLSREYNHFKDYL